MISTFPTIEEKITKFRFFIQIRDKLRLFCWSPMSCTTKGLSLRDNRMALGKFDGSKMGKKFPHGHLMKEGFKTEMLKEKGHTKQMIGNLMVFGKTVLLFQEL